MITLVQSFMGEMTAQMVEAQRVTIQQKPI